MKNFHIIDFNDAEWSKIISLAHYHDFYHTQSYSKLDTSNEPLLCVTFMNDDFIALPIIIKSIPGTDLYDCTSVYGYCGPISNRSLENVSEELISYFQQDLLSYFESRNLVSAFSRLHPFIKQERVFNGLGTIREINKTVAIDLTIPKEEQVSNYRKNHRKDIEKLRKENFRVTQAASHGEIDLFVSMYHDLMKRINSDVYYFFSKDYFYRFLDNPCFEAKLLLAKYNNDIAAGALITLNRDIIQIHLCCDNIDYRKFSPLKLLFDEARIIGCERNVKYLHLGGGVNGSSDDSLFHFKAGFSDLRFTFKTWQLIIDNDKYRDLVQKFNIESINAQNYFPAYRAK